MFETENSVNSLGLMKLDYQPTLEEMECSVCHICHEHTKLTNEHIPPQSAFNKQNINWDRNILCNGKMKLISTQSRNGFYVKTLCAKCNNSLCSPYAAEYVNWVKHLAGNRGLSDPYLKERLLISVPVDVLKVAKEIATMILALEPLELGVHLPDLRRFVLQPKERFNPPFKVLGFLVPFDSTAGTVEPSHMRFGSENHSLNMHAGEISRWPFGFVYSWELGRGYNPDLLTDITGWFWGEKPPFVSFPVCLTVIDAFQCHLGHTRNRPQCGISY